ncbi:hypothetical protein [Novosphingobium guangzhouense]|uniref:Uncharacterized protein n=1 Tax=Novosphingobium guangzhouense TaxID=1850347 RepID=A0A2K2FYU1_9SPHN|nr:hypothetical protein [Novosphingobium guangzhouense]PNU03951.1 hypothetical protein A8V01_04840 [Novosphingobium guangzhouense]
MSAHDTFTLACAAASLILSAWNLARLRRQRLAMDALEARVREIAREEIDADEVWRSPEPGKTYAAQRSRRAASRKGAVLFGMRENTDA